MYDPTGALTFAASYDPYGVPFEQFGFGSSLGFTGEHTDVNGLQYLRARYYNPSLAMFLSRDPVMGMVGGQAIRWNPYSYAGANPVNYVDPSGRLFWFIPMLLYGAALGFGVGVGLDTVGQAIYISQHGGEFNLGQALRAGTVGAAAGFFGALTLGAASSFAGFAGIYTTTTGATAYGVGALALSGVVGGRAAVATDNLLSGRRIDDNLFNAGDMLRDAVLAVGFTALFGRAWNYLRGTNHNFFTNFLPKNGHRFAGKVLRGGTGKAFAGHGEKVPFGGETTVPKGTSIRFWVAEGSDMPDGMGLMIERGDYEALRASPRYSRYLKEWVVNAGETVPDYHLFPPDADLTIMGNSISVSEETALSQLLKPNMGCMDWAACLTYPLSKY